jgi:hypothetical protein
LSELILSSIRRVRAELPRVHWRSTNFDDCWVFDPSYGVLMSEPSWSKISSLLKTVTESLYSNWSVLLPPAAIQSSPEVELACDEACREIAKDILGQHEVLPGLRSLILARMIVAQEIAGIHATPPTSVLAGALPARLQWLLIDQWRTHGEKLWPAICARPVLWRN